MPGKVKVRVLAGRNLPVMDRASDTSDAFVEVKLGSTTYKTDVYRKSLNPHWNSEWFKFEMDDEELQDEPLQIRVMDYDTYSANDAIGKVYIDLSPLLLSRDSTSVMSGWIPIYDTMHGIRGEVNVIVKVELFIDLNRYGVSSCGIKFYCVAGTPQGFRIQTIQGFVEELVANDDPEYQWIDKIRTPRASNEARQTLFSKLSGEVQRKIGLKTIELGGNAVVGYQQCFDLEGESGIVVRGLGTAVTLVKLHETAQHSSSPLRETSTRESPAPDDVLRRPSSPAGAAGLKLSQSPAKGVVTISSIRSIDAEPASLNSKVGGTTGISNSASCAPGHPRQPPVLSQNSLEMLEYPFLSMTQFSPGFIVKLGGVVSARSVKLLGNLPSNIDEPETRDTWWTEIRMEMRAHARVIGCNVVLGYSETTSICEDVCLLSATGTAAIANFRVWVMTPSDRRDAAGEKASCLAHADKEALGICDGVIMPRPRPDEFEDAPVLAIPCNICHIPYNKANVPFPVTLVQCAICWRSHVPDILLTTIDLPPNIPTTGKGCLIQSRVCRLKRDAKGEQCAKEISDSLPFLEYELHRQLTNKLKVKGMNSMFGIRIKVSVGAKILVAVATGTGVFLSALPAPQIPKISSGKGSDESRVNELQNWVCETVQRNRTDYGLRQCEPDKDRYNSERYEDQTNSDGDLADLDFSSGNRDACVIEIDDSEDVDIVSLLIDPQVPPGFDVCTTEFIHGVDNLACNSQLFTRVFRSRIPASGLNTKQFAKIFDSVIQSLFFKFRKMTPCALCNLQFFVELPDDDELQLIVLGTNIGLSEPARLQSTCAVSHLGAKLSATKLGGSENNSEAFGGAEETHATNCGPMSRSRSVPNDSRKSPQGAEAPRHGHGQQEKWPFHQERHGIDISSLSYIPGERIEKYLGNLHFFFIRECTALRECGGLSGFMQCFVAEVLAIVRSHVAALGGNALVGFFMNQCVLLHNPHKNQGQCLINVGGDAVLVESCVVLQPVSDLGSVSTSPPSGPSLPATKPATRGSPKEVVGAAKTPLFVSHG